MQYHKRVHSPSEYDLLTSEHARKKYITEQVAREMAAMSLSQQDQWQHYNQFTQAPPPPPPPTQTTTATMNTTPSAPPPPQQQPKESLSKEDQDINLVKTKVNGTYLPLEQRPGDEKLRIPDFILHPNRQVFIVHIILFTDYLNMLIGYKMYVISHDIHHLSNGAWLLQMKN